MGNSDFPCKVDIQTPDQLRAEARRFFSRESSRDFRDVLVGIAWIYHTAALLGCSPDLFLEKLEPDASVYMSKLIRNFLGRSSKEKSMESWCMYVAETGEGKYVEMRTSR